LDIKDFSAQIENCSFHKGLILRLPMQGKNNCSGLDQFAITNKMVSGFPHHPSRARYSLSFQQPAHL
jgi:hypothetical protein